jgi:hypothetical protein
MRDRKQRKYGQDQPWREERRQRYPDEPYGGEADYRSSADDRQRYRGRESAPNQDWRSRDMRGADYRRDFAGPEGYGEHDFDRDRSMDWSRERPLDWPAAGRAEWPAASRGDWNQERWNRGASFGFGPEEDIERGGNYAYGSPYGQGDMGTDRAGRGWQDTDWAVNRPARGRGAWAGDWGVSSTGENYAGRGPKDYRRSDERIREEVCDMFTDDWRLDASDVTVKVDSCEVTLAGTVATRDQKRRAEEIAERVRGVNDVHNQIRVLRGETTNTAMTAGAQQTAPRGGRASGSQTQQQGIAHDRDRDRDR